MRAGIGEAALVHSLKLSFSLISSLSYFFVLIVINPTTPQCSSRPDLLLTKGRLSPAKFEVFIFDQRRRAGVFEGSRHHEQCTSTRKEAVSICVDRCCTKRICGHNLSDILFFLYFEDSEYWLLKCRMFNTTGSKMISNRQVNDVGSYSDPPLNRYANN